MYAIRNVKTGKFLYDTDYRYFPPIQRMLVYDTLVEATTEFRRRKCSEDYKIAQLNPIKINHLINPTTVSR